MTLFCSTHSESTKLTETPSPSERCREKRRDERKATERRARGKPADCRHEDGRPVRRVINAAPVFPSRSAPDWTCHFGSESSPRGSCADCEAAPRSP
ncbi:hypothetical protein SKAU_G00413940 [Synaphobranchus kaupii]|uniref:Uncharacterized protein n=1 Tax=Synaphobranchus kaupii TaxID=118154 RepID=A0A9Q1E711_SYNKA|nr:hypothetical protein SKAU_G00413940 [Synaphobranchus kaupii]